MPKMFDYFCKVIRDLAFEQAIQNHNYKDMTEGGSDKDYRVEFSINNKKYIINVKEENDE